jgi:hypothetical protein
MIYTLLARAGANLIQALLWGIAFYFLRETGVTKPFSSGHYCQAIILVNGVVFNLFRCHPER